MITGNSDVPMAVQAMKAGASDFIEKPIGRDELLAGIERALEQSQDTIKLSAWQRDAQSGSASSRRDSDRSWTWSLPVIPARTSLPTSISANARWKTIGLRS